MSVEIRTEDLQGQEIAELLAEHARLMLASSPPGSCHFLPLDDLRKPDIRMWSMWDDADLLGCGALKFHDAHMGEIKSMHTRQNLRGNGLGRMMLVHILDHARNAGLTDLYLETGSQDVFIPARNLYLGHGFAECGPFADYQPDPNSVFMHKALG